MLSTPSAGRWWLGLEFEIPRRERRIDAVLVADGVLFLFEVKAGAVRFDRASCWQLEQYALDLRDFHEGSGRKVIVPLLITTESPASEPLDDQHISSGVTALGKLCAADVGTTIVDVYSRTAHLGERSPVGEEWEDAAYRPTPTIIQAARELYEDHDVREIAISGSENLDQTVDAVLELADQCRAQRRRGIAFITGSPGSGKTLAGLQIAHDRRLAEHGANGVFLSGNRPLVEVIRNSLARSTSGRVQRERRHRVQTFVQHAYAFRNEYASRAERVPNEHVVLFDEAQRAWDAAQVSRFTRGQESRSEPHMLLDIMSRRADWAVVVAMVGSGQEINTGEAGLAEWGRVLAENHVDWLVAASPQVLPGSPPRTGGRLFENDAPNTSIRVDPRLHLEMNVRSPRAERLNTWVDSVLERDVAAARAALPDPREFPFVFTRSLATAREWLRDRCGFDPFDTIDGLPDDRCGLVASAAAKRLRAWGLDTTDLHQRQAWADWYLRPWLDVRSSNQLEVPATNFDCQGLELDWVGVCWGNDFYPDAVGSWHTREFRGQRWNSVRGPRRRYLINSYRVLLTRARRGQIIWVPKSDGRDPTLEPERFDAVADFLQGAGLQLVD